MKLTEVQLPGGPEAPAQARRAVLEELGDRLPGRLLQDAGLLVSELVTNSVLHGHTGAEAFVGLRLDVNPQRVRVEVRDPGPGFGAPPRPTGPDDPGGYGLFLVTQIADAWGVAEDGDPTRVWFELRRP